MRTGDVEGSDDVPFKRSASFVDPAFFNRVRNHADNLRQRLRQNFHRRSFDDAFGPGPKFASAEVLLNIPLPPNEKELADVLVRRGLTEKEIIKWRDEGITAYLAFLFPPSWALSRNIQCPRETNSFTPIRQMRSNFEFPDLLLRRRPIVEWKSRASSPWLGVWRHGSLDNGAAQRLMNRLVSTTTRRKRRRKTERPIWGRPSTGGTYHHPPITPMDSNVFMSMPSHNAAPPSLTSSGNSSFPPNYRISDTITSCLRTASESYSLYPSPRAVPPASQGSSSLSDFTKNNPLPTERRARAYFCSRTFANGARRWDENGQCWVSRKYRIRLHTSTGHLILDRPAGRNEGRKSVLEQQQRSLRQRLFVEKSRSPVVETHDYIKLDTDTLREDVTNELEVGRLGPDVQLGRTPPPPPHIVEDDSPPILPNAPSEVCALVLDQFQIIERVTDLRQVKDRIDFIGGLGCIALAELAAEKSAAPNSLVSRRRKRLLCFPKLCRTAQLTKNENDEADKSNNTTNDLNSEDEYNDGYNDNYDPERVLNNNDDSFSLVASAFLKGTTNGSSVALEKGILLISCMNERPLVVVTETELEAIQLVRIISSLEEYWS